MKNILMMFAFFNSFFYISFFGGIVDAVFGGGGGSGGGSTSSTTTEQGTEITNTSNLDLMLDNNYQAGDTSTSVNFDFKELAKSQLAQIDLDKEMFLYGQDLTAYELGKQEDKEEIDKVYNNQKRALELKQMKDDSTYKKYMLIIGFVGLGYTIYKGGK